MKICVTETRFLPFIIKTESKSKAYEMVILGKGMGK